MGAGTLAAIGKLKTYIPGFDLVAHGGLPKDRTTLIVGTAGSAKTTFAAQFLAAGITHADESGVFVTFEESPTDVRRNVAGLGWHIEAWEKQKKWAFVDASPQPLEDVQLNGQYDLGALLARVEHAIHQVNAKRVSIDAIGSLLLRLPHVALIRSELLRLFAGLRLLEVTTLLTTERVNDHGELTRHGVEEFVADNVIIFRNALEDEKRRRTMEILKFRGTTHIRGEVPFTINPQQGVVLLPLTDLQLKQRSSVTRITAGNVEIDAMCGGGFFRDSIVLVSGATGTGKTLLTTQFLAGGIRQGERCLLLAFEESREQLFRNAQGWGIDFEKMEEEGSLRVICEYPEVASLEDHLLRMKTEVEEFKPHRLTIDSLSALERISTEKGFREFVIDFTSFVKHREIAGVFTATTPTLMGGISSTEAHISTLTDSIILLRYIEIYGEMRRGITILKMRGSTHGKEIREFTIDGRGMHIGQAFRNVTGIISGNPVYLAANEINQLETLGMGKN